ncbi:hypothetical protein CXG81DRAFT_24899 [Caulochytrium protostelioides]|uniref:Erythromycin biosynthesis protein CIII-like C-terminal domain-containing protein n=1 Tax=Caulochytrium protostelioides TaxID=1555241 RepID=A0A4P9XAP2_9FUNG|nr:hypothetical protein CXG81DRAFT_24899 [Caulochytrium protostelioides]|eukprot:RKP02437.1 hypothetical protein CXG81DRAFT_24899 [Caulochytrium protostelioides]
MTRLALALAEQLPDQRILFASGGNAERILAAAQASGKQSTPSTPKARVEFFPTFNDIDPKFQRRMNTFAQTQRPSATASLIPDLLTDLMFGDAAYFQPYERLLALLKAEGRPDYMICDWTTNAGLDLAISFDIPFTILAPGGFRFLLLNLAPFERRVGLGGPVHPTFLGSLHQLFYRCQVIWAIARSAAYKQLVRRRRAHPHIHFDSFRPEDYGVRARSIIAPGVFGFEQPIAAPANLALIGAFIHPKRSDPVAAAAATMPEAASTASLSGVMSPPRTPPSQVRFRPQGSRPRIYVNLGTIYQILPDRRDVLLRALGQVDADVRWKLARDLWPKDMDAVPANVTLVPWVEDPLAELEDCAVFVSHGGGNSAAEALWTGAVMLCIPAWLDCVNMCSRIDEVGTGLTLSDPPFFTEDEIVSKLYRLLNEPLFKAKAMFFRQRAQAAGGIPAAVAHLRRQIDEEAHLQRLLQVAATAARKAGVPEAAQRHELLRLTSYWPQVSDPNAAAWACVKFGLLYASVTCLRHLVGL